MSAYPADAMLHVAGCASPTAPLPPPPTAAATREGVVDWLQCQSQLAAPDNTHDVLHERYTNGTFPAAQMATTLSLIHI